jgi:hypothetical protein
MLHVRVTNHIGWQKHLFKQQTYKVKQNISHDFCHLDLIINTHSIHVTSFFK